MFQNVTNDDNFFATINYSRWTKIKKQWLRMKHCLNTFARNTAKFLELPKAKVKAVWQNYLHESQNLGEIMLAEQT